MSESCTASGEKSLYVEQVRQLYSHGLVGIIGTPANGLIVVLILRNIIPFTVLTAWLSALAGITLVRMVAGVFYALLFADTILPDGTGLEVIEHIRREQPGLKMLLGSGYPGEKIQQDIIRNKKIPFIQKPYEVNELLMTVKHILTRK